MCVCVCFYSLLFFSCLCSFKYWKCPHHAGLYFVLCDCLFALWGLCCHTPSRYDLHSWSITLLFLKVLFINHLNNVSYSKLLKKINSILWWSVVYSLGQKLYPPLPLPLEGVFCFSLGEASPHKWWTLGIVSIRWASTPLLFHFIFSIWSRPFCESLSIPNLLLNCLSTHTARFLNGNPLLSDD